MTPYIRAVRALTATVFQRVYRPVAWVIGGILCLLFILITWLGATISHWWWVLFVFITPLTIALTITGIVLWLLSEKLQPRRLQSSERTLLEAFADKLMRIAEVRATPVPVLVFLIAKDVVRGRKSTYLEHIIKDSSSLAGDFAHIRDMFV